MNSLEINLVKSIVEPLADEKITKVKKSTNRTNMRTWDKEQKAPNFVKVGKGLMVDKETGEIVECKINESGVRSNGSLSKSFKRVRVTAEHNFFGLKSELYIVLTFNREILDLKELSVECEKFWNKLNNKENQYELFSKPYRMLVTIEPNEGESNRYHLNCLLKRLDNKELFIPHQVLMEIWGNGGVHVKGLWDSGGLSGYLNSLYVKKKSGLVYPSKLQIYRCYGAFEKVEKFDMKHGEIVRQIIGEGYKEDSIRTFDIIGTDKETGVESKFNRFTDEVWVKPQSGRRKKK